MSGRAGASLLLLRSPSSLLFRRPGANDSASTTAALWASSGSRDRVEDNDQKQRSQAQLGGGLAAAAASSSAPPSSASASPLLLTARVGSGGGARRQTPPWQFGAGGPSATPPLPHGLAASMLLLSQQQQHRHGLTTSAAPRKKFDGGDDDDDVDDNSKHQHQKLADVQGLLDSLSALRLREELAAASDATPYVPHARLLEIVRETGAADTAAEAERVADALVRAGVVLRLGGVVYLRPHEVAEMVLASVPSDGSAAAQRLREIERELEALDRAHADIVAQARRWPRFWLGAGCAAFAAQLAGFIYLCYWELSWDVVEPLACFVSMGWTLVAWLYFLARGSALDYDAFDSHWTQAGLERRMAARGFDPERHEQLALARDRYRRYLSAQRAAALAEGVPAGGVVSSSSSSAAAGLSAAAGQGNGGGGGGS